MVPGTGIEPVQPCGRGILSPLRLPISPSGRLLCGLYPVHRNEKGKARICAFPSCSGAGDESRTRDLNLGKVALYQLSYSRVTSGGAIQSRTGLAGFAIRCITALLSRHDCLSAVTVKSPAAFLEFWSGRRVSNSRPQPWQGCALPTELLPRKASAHYKDLARCVKEISVFRPCW